MSKTILLGSAVALGVFAFLFLLSPMFNGFGYGGMMGGRYSGQSWGPRACPAVSDYDGGYRSNGWGMMGNWR
jgi:hypothetical protein